MRKSSKKVLPKREPKKSGYEYVRAIRDADGSLRFEYKMHGNSACVLGHDEDVSEWSERDIVKLACALLDANPEDVRVENE